VMCVAFMASRICCSCTAAVVVAVAEAVLCLPAGC
jgi:hypothetical protein